MLRSIKYGVYGAVLAGLIAAPVAWMSVDKAVHLVVDGHATTIRTTASDVAELLADQGYQVDDHDLVAPAAGSALHDGMQVVVRHGRLLHLDVDGAERDVWTTAPTVQVALAQLGYTSSDFVSVSRSQRLPLSPTDLTIRTPRSVTVIHDGGAQQMTTTAPTVGTLLTQMGLGLDPQDRILPGVATPLTDGMRIVIERVDRHHVVRTKKLAFDTHRVKDASLLEGKTQISQYGRDGVAQIRYSVVFVDGRRVAKTRLGETVVRRPRAQIVQVGTKPPVSPLTLGGSGSSGGSGAPPAGIPSPGSAQAIAKQMLIERGWGDPAQFSCLVTLWNDESGWRVNAANPSGAYGIPQALPGSKMASAGPDWQTNATTQITWGLNYIAERYGTPCGAWAQWQANGGWY